MCNSVSQKRRKERKKEERKVGGRKKKVVHKGSAMRETNGHKETQRVRHDPTNFCKRRDQEVSGRNTEKSG